MEDLRAVIDRFWSKVGPCPADQKACWEWIGATNADGRGRFGFRGRVEVAYRVSFVLSSGEIPDGLDVLHTCDNPKCVRPIHLFVGTAKDNVADMHAKGRSGRPSAKLTPDTVRAIRKEWETTRPRQRVLAAKYGVHQTIISAVVNRSRWKDVI